MGCVGDTCHGHVAISDEAVAVLAAVVCSMLCVPAAAGCGAWLHARQWAGPPRTPVTDTHAHQSIGWLIGEAAGSSHFWVLWTGLMGKLWLYHLWECQSATGPVHLKHMNE